MQVSITTPHAAEVPGTASEWLRVIHAVNGLAPGTFGEPTTQGDPTTDEGYVETYPDATVTLRDVAPYVATREGTATIASSTQRGAHLLALAAATATVTADGSTRSQILDRIDDAVESIREHTNASDADMSALRTVADLLSRVVADIDRLADQEA